MTTRKDIEQVLWNACDSFRGKIDSSRYKDYILSMLFEMCIRDRDNCKSQSEYIEKAVRFYSGYLDTEHAEEYLPRVLSDVLEGKLGAFGKRMGHLLFKQAVDQDVMANLLASDINVGLDTLQKLRVRCVKNVKETRCV